MKHLHFDAVIGSSLVLLLILNASSAEDNCGPILKYPDGEQKCPVGFSIVGEKCCPGEDAFTSKHNPSAEPASDNSSGTAEGDSSASAASDAHSAEMRDEQQDETDS